MCGHGYQWPEELEAMTTKEPSAAVERMKIVAWLRRDRRSEAASVYGFEPKWQQELWKAADAIERGDHDTAEPGLCPRETSASRWAFAGGGEG